MINFSKLGFIFSLSLLAITTSFSQNSGNLSDSYEYVLDALEKQTYDFVQEKVYLHLDKPYYSKGEDIWFKAYTVAGPNHTPTPLSENLYVELVNSGGQIIKRHTIHLNKGLGNGDFHLNDTLTSGSYTIRAYTNWMRNFNEAFFFSKDIKLLDNKEESGKSTPPSTAQPTIRFFPEGGEMIANISSRVAFEVSNYTEESLKGKIFDQNGKVITSFESVHQGLGVFNFKALSNVNYFAQFDNYPEKFALPSPKSNGFGLMVNQDNDNVIVKITSPAVPATQNQKAYLLAHTRGIIGFSSRLEWKNEQATIRIPKDNLVEGIVHITLFDDQWRPEAERLIFKQPNEDIKIDVSTERNPYNPRDSTTLKIVVKDKDGNPAKGFFSFAAVDTRQIDINQFNDNIVSSLLFSSDLDRAIANPIQYFNSNNATSSSEIDLILMTQGWRRFLWKDILNDQFPDNSNHIEQGFKISGVVTNKSDKRVRNGSVKQIGNFNGVPSFAQASIQQDGTFEIDNLKYYGSDILLKAVKGKDNENVQVTLDSLTSQNLPNSVDMSTLAYKTMGSEALSEFYKQRDERELFDEAYDVGNISAFLENNKQRKLIDSTYNFDSSKDLGEFVVEGDKFINKDRPDRTRGLVYGAGPQSLDVSQLMATGQRYTDALNVVQGRIPGIKVILNETGEPTVRLNRPVGLKEWADGPPLFLLDDAPIPLSALTALRAETIKRVEIFKGVQAYHLYGSSGSNGVIAYYSKTIEEYEADQQKMFAREDGFTHKKVPIRIPQGYYLAKQFYAPNYGKKLSEHVKPDRRALIHWEPMIETDENGVAEITFYNADLETTIQLNIEGIWEGGIPLAASTTYQVKKK